MGNSLRGLLLGATAVFAAFSSSTTYQLQNYGLSGAASNDASSTTYQLESSTGQVQSVSTASLSYSTLAGSLQAQQANVPPAPALSNGGGTFYNKLGLIINNGGNPSDTTFAVAVSTNNFVTTNYVQADGSLGASPLFLTYAAWGGATGTTIIGLSVNTSYQVKASAMQGKYTNSAYGPVASASTVNPSLVFSVSPNSLTLPNLLSGSIVTSGTISATISTNASYGGNIYLSDSNAGLRSTVRSYTIPSATVNLSLASNGYGAQGTSVSQTSGGPLAILSPYNVLTTNVGAISTTPRAIFGTTAPIVGGIGNTVIMAKAASTDPAAADYTDTLTFIAAASF